MQFNIIALLQYCKIPASQLCPCTEYPLMLYYQKKQ